MPVRAPGVAEVAGALLEALEAADISGWPPGWAVSDRPAELWAVHDDVAFPLARADAPGRWGAVTCLRRPAAGGGGGQVPPGDPPPPPPRGPPGGQHPRL